MSTFSTPSKKIILWLCCVLVLASCNMPVNEASTASSQAWLDQPTTASLLPLSPFTLKAHARGANRIDFLVNDVQVGSVATDPGKPIVYAETSWNPAATGSYTVSAQAFFGDGSVRSQVATVCVSNTVTVASVGFSGDCTNPNPSIDMETPTPSTGPITVAANINSNPVYYGNCDPHTLNVTAVLSGDLSLLDTVRVKWAYDTETSSSHSGLGSVPFEQNEMIRQPDGSYLWSTDLNTAATGWGLTGDPYVISVYVTAWDSSGHSLGMTGPISTKWQACSAPSAVPSTPTFLAPTFTALPMRPSFTPVPVIPTFTATSAPVDTTPPSITITQINPSDLAYYTTGCGPNAITVQANVKDASGIANVTLTYQYSNGSSSTLAMNSIGGNNYQATLPLDTNTYNVLLGANGSVSFQVNAADVLGNSGNAPAGPVTLMFCPG